MIEKPLAYRMRPRNLDEFVGQEHLVGVGKPLRVAIEKKNLSTSLIFWGPPGCGKTTLAKMISRLTESEFVELSAVSAGKADVKKAVQKARLFNKKTILFLDEIHRFNKAQQDFLLPYVENGTITLIGATTENPSFEVISALLSRSCVYVLDRLKEEEILRILKNVLAKDEFLNGAELDEESLSLISGLSNGDARSALNILEIAFSIEKTGKVSKKSILDATQKSYLRYDKNGEEHYNIISALHKSMRDSDVQGAVYWTMRMIDAGEDPKYVVRRMIRFASEDIGDADPMALQVAVAAKEAVNFLGYPECDVALVQTAVYLANAPKSNSVYKAVLKAREDIERTGNLPVPLHLRNAPTKLMKNLKYGKGYKYVHDYKDTKVNQQHLPDELNGKIYYDALSGDEDRSSA